MTLPPCGTYKTTAEIGSIPADRLVYFHNHGEPGPGLYLPENWLLNRAQFSAKGHTLADLSAVSSLQPIAPEGLYRVDNDFVCCEKQCRTFQAGLLVQLGYNRQAQPILFEPVWDERGLAIPERGQLIDEERVDHLNPLKVRTRTPSPAAKTEPMGQLH